eukprot:2353165-Prymnesium_polylepis.1
MSCFARSRQPSRTPPPRHAPLASAMASARTAVAPSCGKPRAPRTTRSRPNKVCVSPTRCCGGRVGTGEAFRWRAGEEVRDDLLISCSVVLGLGHGGSHIEGTRSILSPPDAYRCTLARATQSILRGVATANAHD